jgi:diguanylate cyclase (GGDEF)-like protein/PAS domain S-box-containing protein
LLKWNNFVFTLPISQQFSASLNKTNVPRWVVRVALVTAICYASGRAGLWLPIPGININSGRADLLWPLVGVALAVFTRWGIGVWPGVWAGLLLTAMQGTSGATPGWVAVLSASGTTLAVATAVLGMRRWGLNFSFTPPRDVCIALGVVTLGASLFSAVNTSFWMAASGSIHWSQVPPVVLQHGLSSVMGSVAVGLPLFALLVSSRSPWHPLVHTRPTAATGLLLLGALLSCAWAASTGPRAVPSALVFLPHLFLYGLAAHSGLAAAASCALLLVCMTLLTTQWGWGPFIWPDSAHELSFFTGYLCSLLGIAPLSFALKTALPVNRHGPWQRALEQSDIGVAQYHLQRQRIELSGCWWALLGYASAATNPVFGQNVATFWNQIHPDDRALVQQNLASASSGLTAQPAVECRMACRDGSWHWLSLQAMVAPQPACMIVTARSATALRAAREREQLSESLFQHLHEGLLITDAMHRVIEVNPTFTDITGRSREELLGTVPSLLQPAPLGSDAAVQLGAMQAAMHTSGMWRGEMVDHRVNGDPCLLQVTVTAVRNPDGSVRNHVVAIADVTHARRQLEQLQRQAHFDELTRLPNRVRLAQMLDTALETSRRDGSLLTVCYLDLDHFKPVNDHLGHQAGDRLLLELANRMRRSLRSWAGGDDVIARMGGDEFVLLLRTTTLEESRHAVERVLYQVCQPYTLEAGSEPVTVTASVGATVFPLDGADAETLLRHADHAMYGAKQAGRNGYLFFDAEHDRRAQARFVALGRVQEALSAREFKLYFQPKVQLRTGQVLGVEALLRWRHPEHGIVLPSQFLPLIENTNLSTSVGNWVLQQGIEQLAQWLDQGLNISVSINISAHHLQEPLFARHLTKLLDRHPPLVAQSLIIEVLETAALADVDYTCTLIQECKALGVRFALDDFGTGYSTFTYLKRLPIDMLKIDRSFVTNMLSDRQDLAIVEGVIGLSQTFSCSVVAEGVETKAQARRLIEVGCEVGQGNGIAEAMPAEQVAGWVQNYRGLMTHSEKVTA